MRWGTWNHQSKVPNQFNTWQTFDKYLQTNSAHFPLKRQETVSFPWFTNAQLQNS